MVTCPPYGLFCGILFFLFVVISLLKEECLSAIQVPRCQEAVRHHQERAGLAVLLLTSSKLRSPWHWFHEGSLCKHTQNRVDSEPSLPPGAVFKVTSEDKVVHKVGVQCSQCRLN